MATARAASMKGSSKAPTEWDARIVKYVKFVEKTRGLTFDHPIPVVFLDDAKFVKELNGDNQGPTKQERKQADRYAGQLRALGLVEGDVDLIGANKDLDASTVTGFYDDHDKRMVIRGTNLDAVNTRVTVVHELTHALQDQRFNLHKLDNQARTSGEDFATTALIEGDASYVEEAYFLSLTPKEQNEYDNADPTGTSSTSSTGSTGSTSSAPAAPDEAVAVDIPPVLDVFQSAPYVFGLRFVAFLDGQRGNEAIDAAFAGLPKSEEQIVDPVAFLLHENPAKVPVPKLGAGEKPDGAPDTFGAFSLYVLLASRLDAKVALTAAEGWGGDRYLAFRRDGKECVHIDLVGDTIRDSREIGAALDQWAATMPTGAATVGHDGTRTTLATCESTAAAPSTDTFDAAVSLLSLRNELLNEIAQEVDPKPARCVADRAAVDTELAPIFDKSDLTNAEKTLIRTRLRAFVSACGG